MTAVSGIQPVGRPSRVTRKHTLLLAFSLLAIAAVLCSTVFKRSLAVAYHQWRMEAAYGSLFSNPQPVGNGLARYDVTATDVDAAIKSYESHRQSLVELNALAHVTTSFPHLANEGTDRRVDTRSAFVNRMWDVFPNHRHYWLAPDGTFEAWVPASKEHNWKTFLNGESNSPQ